jgi:transposase
MLPQHGYPSQANASPTPARVGIGIDTARYGHYAAFLRDDLQPAAPELQFTESADGYAALRQRIERIAARLGAVHFHVRLDAAGQYADNLLHYLHGLGARLADVAPHTCFSLSTGDPQRNKNYRAAVFGGKKSDPIEARAAARFALSERPAAVAPLPDALRSVRHVAARLHAVVRQRTRLINQLHHLLALTFPELALIVHDIAAGWVLELVHRYPTAHDLGIATEAQLADVPYLPERHIPALVQAARASIGSLQGLTAAELVRDQVRQLRDVRARQKRLENLLVSAYRALPTPNHLDTIPGIGAVTAAVLTAFILDIDRFKAPGQLVAYFGTLPVEVASGVDRDGQPRGPKRYVMSRRGHDLVRRYLWMAALSAVRCNPAVRALYARVVAKHANKKALAIGHAMRKLLHLAFAVWKTGKPFDPNHYSWHAPAHVELPPGHAPDTEDTVSAQSEAVGHTLDEPARQVVTAASAAARDSLPHHPSAAPAYVDFAHIKRQLPIARVLDQLGLTPRLRGQGLQQRCTCPIHRGDARGRTFSVHLGNNVFQCFDAQCGKKGDVIDLWASVTGLALRDAALDLIRTFGLESAPAHGTEKRKG